MWVRAAVGIGGLGVIGGFAIGCAFRGITIQPWGGMLMLAVDLLAIFGIAKWSFRRLDELESERENMSKGAAGEVAVGLRLREFPDEFRVIHDLATPSGNLDHIVVGPTGVFIIDTKNWRGVVASDGNGELTLNGQALDKPYVRRFVARVLNVKEKVQVLAAGLDPYFQTVFVFTAARVEANFGTTGAVHCVREERLFDYIVNKRFGKKLSVQEVDTIARAFVGLANMEVGFIEKTRVVNEQRERPLCKRRTEELVGV